VTWRATVATKLDAWRLVFVDISRLPSMSSGDSFLFYVRGAGLAVLAPSHTSGTLRIAQRPREKMMAAATKASAVRMPDSPTHNVASGAVAGSNAI
jgi:hypothetical protein